jgi:hypothetical protein
LFITKHKLDKEISDHSETRNSNDNLTELIAKKNEAIENIKKEKQSTESTLEPCQSNAKKSQKIIRAKAKEICII